MATNPLLDFSNLPRFDKILPEHVKPAIEELLEQSRQLINELVADAVPATWDGFVAPLTDKMELLSRAWGIAEHLHAVNDTPSWRHAYNEMLPTVSGFYAELGQNEKLFAKYEAILGDEKYPNLSRAQQRIVGNEIRDFKLSGAMLSADLKKRFKAIKEELASLSAKFSENLLDATNAYTENIVDEKALKGLPEDTKMAARRAAQDKNISGWLFDLHMPSYLPVMQYADDRALRERMYRAYVTRAAEFNDATSRQEWNNAPIIKHLLQLRKESAEILDYQNFAEVSLVPKMADSPAVVLGFLRELAVKARPFAFQDYQELKAFAQSALKISPIKAWDIHYASEKLLQKKYAFSASEVKQYFTEPKVIEGLFTLVKKLFGVTIKEDKAPVWHQDVRFYRIENSSGEHIGQFYMDLYARATKRGGAWMDEARSRRRLGQAIQTPIAYLNCNFSRPPSEGDHQPATFTHDEVITLFHEMGHCLHHLLTRADDLQVSGIHGVEWDAIELPSQFMENYCWEWEVIQAMTEHIDSKKPLPRELFDKMLAAKNFLSGLMMVRQLEFSLFDMRLHCDFDPDGESCFTDILEDVRREVAVIPTPSWNRFPSSFLHIFSGGYAAGYFSYKWAEVLSADAYAAFEEVGDPFDPLAGKRFLDEILSVGGTRPAMESFKAFRGRKPRVDALLRHNGMIVS